MSCAHAPDPEASGTIILHDPHRGCWLAYQRPIRVLMAEHIEEVRPVVEASEKAAEAGCFVAGFLSYEAAPAFDSALKTKDSAGFPLAWFGVYDSVSDQIIWPELRDTEPLDWGSDGIDSAAYVNAVQRIKRLIQNGDTYQVNYSVRLRAPCSLPAWELFARMVEAQGAHYAAFLNLGDWSICCASPELFFRLDGNHLVSRPMKGTAPRGLWSADDAEQKVRLSESEKNRAENLMIVDMVRNDLGRVATTGSVHVKRLFELERYPTLWQMTSTVEANTTAPLTRILAALFPAASITGAPKIRTAEIIAGLEASPRRIYTGAIGFMGPGRTAQFNVAIRTLLLDKRANTADYGVGAGVVWDSSPEEELKECKLKARILAEPLREFYLIETILWKPESGYFLLEQHLARLAGSADYFDRPFSPGDFQKKLDEFRATLPCKTVAIRVALSKSGALELSARSVPETRGEYAVRLAAHPIDSSNPLLYHKTSDRLVYSGALADGEGEGCSDVLLWNQERELTESTIANLVVKKNGELLTPPVRCGLLPGAHRAWLLQQGKIKERVLRFEDLRDFEKLFLVNSVRGMWEISLQCRTTSLPSGDCSQVAAPTK